MVAVRIIERRGPVLTPSGLACLAGVPTVNLSAGCAHGCVYCYAQGYSQYPGWGTVHVYRGTAERVEAELARKRRRPQAVYFSPSCDAFQPVDVVLEETYRTMQVVLAASVGVAFATKGTVPDRFLDLFVRHPGRVWAQVGLTTLDESLHAMLEPGAASGRQRLDGMTRLRDAGVCVALRADPLIAGVSDLDRDIAALMAECRRRGVRDMSISYLFLRPAVTAAIKRHVTDHALLDRILAPYGQGHRFHLRGGAGGGVALPQAIRRAAFDRFGLLGDAHGMAVHVCGCKNPDVANGRCHLVRNADERENTKPDPPAERLLW
jgi:DNA repair photolyase